ncbi:hypothetical protein AAF712_009039 [Marasmius tenuissimus]|uniref:DUF6593 domain-containing protein n=1 Tax=Marasmius tenuissimus TaxID=585030 RepID=A0ABR2ZUH0_9AGAR
MELIFSNDDPKNAILSLSTGQPIYELYTKSRVFHSESTVIRKFHNQGSPPNDIGQVKLRCLNGDACELLGRDIRPRTEGIVSRQKYGWKRKGSKVLMIDKFENTVAIYQYSRCGILHAKAPAMLSVMPAGVPFLDEIVVTVAYAEQRFRQDVEVAAEGASAAGSAAG